MVAFGLTDAELINLAAESPSYPHTMPNSTDRSYHAAYQRQLRARARQAGFSQLNAIVPGELLAKLDAMKQARGLPNRNETLAAVLREYFEQGVNRRTPAVSP